MQIEREAEIVSSGKFPGTALWQRAVDDVESAILAVDWPHGSGRFSLNPRVGVDETVPYIPKEKDGRAMR